MAWFDNSVVGRVLSFESFGPCELCSGIIPAAESMLVLDPLLVSTGMLCPSEAITLFYGDLQSLTFMNLIQTSHLGRRVCTFERYCCVVVQRT